MSVRPSSFQFHVEPAFLSPATVKLSGGNLVVSMPSFVVGATAATSFQATPTDLDWFRFWKAMEFLELWDWACDYNRLGGATLDQGDFAAEEVGRDGATWSVEINYRDRGIKSQGHYYYPAYSSPAARSFDQERLGMFISALEELLGRQLDIARLLTGRW